MSTNWSGIYGGVHLGRLRGDADQSVPGGPFHVDHKFSGKSGGEFGKFQQHTGGHYGAGVEYMLPAAYAFADTQTSIRLEYRNTHFGKSTHIVDAGNNHILDNRFRTATMGVNIHF